MKRCEECNKLIWPWQDQYLGVVDPNNPYEVSPLSDAEAYHLTCAVEGKVLVFDRGVKEQE